MNDDHTQTRINASYVFGGKSLEVTELQGGWRVVYEGKEAEHPNIDHALGAVLQRSPGQVLGLVRQIMTSKPGSDLGT